MWGFAPKDTPSGDADAAAVPKARRHAHGHTRGATSLGAVSDAATMALARHVAALTQEGSLTSVAGGGDTVAALAQAGVTDDITFISTAGGAFLEWMEGKDLPGVAALQSSDG